MIRLLTSLLCAVALLAPALVPVAGAQMPHQRGKPRMAQSQPAAAPAAPMVSKQSPAADYTPNMRFRLRTELAEGKMAFVGVGGDI